MSKNKLLFPNFPVIEDSNLQRLMQTYISEAKFAYTLIEDDLTIIDKKNSVLEIGSGIGVLSYVIAESSSSVTSLEPSSLGFENMSVLQEFVSKNPHFSHVKNVIKIDKKLEDFEPSVKYDYIFCINVLEHVVEPETFIEKALSLLSENGVLRIICPNYAFPYEGHFNIPIILNKKVTWKLFRFRIQNMRAANYEGLWESLNWITHGRLGRILLPYSIEYNFQFSKKTFSRYIDRLKHDSVFLERKSQHLIKFVPILKFFSVFIPLRIIPMIDCHISKKVGGDNGR